MKKMLLMFSMLCVILFCAYPSGASSAEVTVSAAISLKNAFEEIGKLYEAKYARRRCFSISELRVILFVR